RTIAKISTMIPSMPPPRKPTTAPSARVVRESESFMKWPDRPAQISPLVQPLKESFIVQFFHEAHINEIFRPGGFDLGIFLGHVDEDVVSHLARRQRERWSDDRRLDVFRLQSRDPSGLRSDL